MSNAVQAETMPAPKDWLIVGGGLAALAAAKKLRNEGAGVHIVEAGRGFGGINNSRPWKEFLLDFGCHLFGNESPETTALILEMAGGSAIPVSPKIAAITKGEISIDVEYPDFNHYGPEIAGEMLIDVLAAAADDRVADVMADSSSSLKDLLLARFGQKGTDMLSPIVKKITTLDPEHLSAKAAVQLPVRRILLTDPDSADLLKQVPALDDRILKPSTGTGLDFYQDAKHVMPTRMFYPSHNGLSGFTANCVEGLKSADAHLETGKSVTSIRRGGTAVIATFADGEEIRTDNLLWTSGPDSLAKAAGIDIDTDAIYHKLPMVFYYFDVPSDRAGERHFMIDTSADNHCFRISIPPNYGPGLAPEGRKFICCEVTCEVESDIFQDPDAFAGDIWREAVAAGMAFGDAPDDVLTMKAPATYRFPKQGAEAVVQPLMDWLAETPAVHMSAPFTFGKSGTVRAVTAQLDEA
ncbi:MAG: NAD(P)-binding protein [Maricaulis sp.]|nr:NAD(P)-binding protein [Maricaulis sp.]